MVPNWKAAVASLMPAVACAMIHSSGFLAAPAGPDGPFAQTVPQNLKDAQLIAEGNTVFAEACSIPYCHGKEAGAGRAPALREREWDVSQLHRIVSEGIPNTSMPNFNDKLSERQIWAVVGYILSVSRARDPDTGRPSGDPSGAKTAGELPQSLIGSALRGEELFFASSRGKTNEKSCAVCHSIDGKGNSVGPDLSGSARKSARDLFRDIVFPSARVDPTRQTLRITMRDGERILGLKREETPTSLRVYDSSSNPPVLRRLAKEQIQATEPQSQSIMPATYGEIYTLRQLLDLVSFLKSSGAPSAAKITFVDIQ